MDTRREEADCQAVVHMAFLFASMFTLGALGMLILTATAPHARLQFASFALLCTAAAACNWILCNMASRILREHRAARDYPRTGRH